MDRETKISLGLFLIFLVGLVLFAVDVRLGVLGICGVVMIGIPIALRVVFG